MTNAQRNRAIKTLLAGKFGSHKISVTSGRGTAANWVEVRIVGMPWRQVRAASQTVRQLISAAGIEIDTYVNDSGEICNCILVEG